MSITRNKFYKILTLINLIILFKKDKTKRKNSKYEVKTRKVDFYQLKIYENLFDGIFKKNLSLV